MYNKYFSDDRPTEPGQYWYCLPVWSKPYLVDVYDTAGGMVVKMKNDYAPTRITSMPAFALWKKVLKAGDLISWAYIHHFNSKSRAKRMKHGEYVGKVKHTVRYNGPQLAIVHFYGNKRTSKVPLFDIQEMSIRRKNLIKSQKDIKENF